MNIQQYCVARFARRFFKAPIVMALIAGISALSAQSFFQESVLLETTSETSANASVGDIDGDGDIDILLAKGRHWRLNNRLLFNDGSGGFQEQVNLEADGDKTYTAALADLDGDGDLDVAVGNDDIDAKFVYHNDGAGNFEKAGTFGEPGWDTRNITIVDVNGDDRPDIIVANRLAAQANYICINDGAGRFPDYELLSPEPATTIASGDLNNDGFMDLVVPHRTGGQSYYYLNDGNAEFTRHAFGPSVFSTRASTTGDVNGDGFVDILVGDEGNGGAVLYCNAGDGSFKKGVLIGPRSDIVYSAVIVDLDRDGDNDIVLGNRDTTSVIHWNSGDGTEFEPERFGDDLGAFYGMAVDDLDGNGTLDLVAARSGAPNILYWGSYRVNIRVDEISNDSGLLTIGWQSLAGEVFAVESSTDLTSWSEVENTLPSEGERTTFEWELAIPTPTSLFFRVLKKDQ